MKTEDLEEKGENVVLNSICDWFGIPRVDWDLFPLETLNDGGEYPDMLPETREWLMKFYSTPIRRLNEFMNLDLDWGY